jgi:hypothetical protein
MLDSEKRLSNARYRRTVSAESVFHISSLRVTCKYAKTRALLRQLGDCDITNALIVVQTCHSF